MSPHPHPKPAPRTLLRATLFLALGAAVVALAMPVSAVPADKVLFCHATGSESNPYVSIEASAAGVFNGHLGESQSHQDNEDIIPPFTYQGQQYSQNWDTEGQAIFDAGCGDGETQTETDTETEEVPFFGGTGAGPSMVALGSLGALGGAFLMLRRRL